MRFKILAPGYRSESEGSTDFVIFSNGWGHLRLVLGPLKVSSELTCGPGAVGWIALE